MLRLLHRRECSSPFRTVGVVDDACLAEVRLYLRDYLGL